MSSLLVTTQGHVARITLNRPEVRNAFNDEVIAELTQAFTAVGQDPAVRAVVLAAEGPAELDAAHGRLHPRRKPGRRWPIGRHAASHLHLPQTHRGPCAG